VAGDAVVDFGTVVVVVVVVVGVVVVGVVLGSVAADETDAGAVVEGVVVGVVVAGAAAVDVVVGSAPADGVCVVVSEATRTPRPTAPAAATTPMAAVVLRTRLVARSRSSAAEPVRESVVRGGRGTAFISSGGQRAGPVRDPIHTLRRGSLDSGQPRATSIPPVSTL
jgi:hypothetical protein